MKFNLKYVFTVIPHSLVVLISQKHNRHTMYRNHNIVIIKQALGINALLRTTPSVRKIILPFFEDLIGLQTY